MNLEGKIVFIAGAITGIADYKKIFAAAEQWLLEPFSRSVYDFI